MWLGNWGEYNCLWKSALLSAWHLSGAEYRSYSLHWIRTRVVFCVGSNIIWKWWRKKASQDARLLKKSLCALAKAHTTMSVWLCAIEQTALGPAPGLYVIKMDIVCSDGLVGSHCFNADNCLGHHVLQIHHQLFLNWRMILDLWEKESKVSLELLTHLYGAWGLYAGHTERRRNVRWISLSKENIRLYSLTFSNRNLLELSRSVLGLEWSQSLRSFFVVKTWNHSSIYCMRAVFFLMLFKACN